MVETERKLISEGNDHGHGHDDLHEGGDLSKSKTKTKKMKE